ncbi:MAG TPA: hypothetical protein PKA64_00760, partial [Myxococcota bacterium]|nr:hypothetical protein [Myxococcota bacterium]
MAPMVFFPLGGVPQLRLASADDLAQIGELDRARWGATSMPIDQMFCDPRVLAHLDADHNGRVRVDEILEAQRWLWAHLSGRDGVTEKRDVLRLTDVDTSTTAGARMRALAERLLGQLGAADRSAISLAQVVQFREGYARTFPNGDGVVTPAQISDPALAALAAEVIAGTGGAPDLGGDAGIRAADVDAWVARCEA